MLGASIGILLLNGSVTNVAAGCESVDGELLGVVVGRMLLLSVCVVKFFSFF